MLQGDFPAANSCAFCGCDRFCFEPRWRCYNHSWRRERRKFFKKHECLREETSAAAASSTSLLFPSPHLWDSVWVTPVRLLPWSWTTEEQKTTTSRTRKGLLINMSPVNPPVLLPSLSSDSNVALYMGFKRFIKIETQWLWGKKMKQTNKKRLTTILSPKY